MAYTTIDDPSVYFQTLLYTGNGGSQTMTNDGNSDLQPDWVWIKQRSGTENHYLGNSSIANKFLNSDRTDSESTNISGKELTYNSDGFAFAGSDSTWNGSSSTYVAWQWKANGGTTVSVSASGNGTDADTTKAGTYQANTTAGFSIVTFATGSISNGDHRINHGLGATPHFILTKSRDNGGDWYTYHHKGTDDNDYFRINHANGTSNAGSRNTFDGSDFTSTYFEMDYNNILLQNENFVAYCFTEIQGYSKFGTYTGNGNADGTFIYLGFKPALVIQKQTSANGEYWMMKDSAREPFNQVDANIYPNATNVDGDTNGVDFLSNGFKCRTNGAGSNASGATYIYIAFAEHPFVSSKGIPVTAR